jgi:hypothetical protein
MRDDDLRASVSAELLWDPRVDSRDIVVSADGGAVRLAGSVASMRQKCEAQSATRRVYGVTNEPCRSTPGLDGTVILEARSLPVRSMTRRSPSHGLLPPSQMSMTGSSSLTDVASRSG